MQTSSISHIIPLTSSGGYNITVITICKYLTILNYSPDWNNVVTIIVSNFIRLFCILLHTNRFG